MNSCCYTEVKILKRISSARHSVQRVRRESSDTVEAATYSLSKPSLVGFRDSGQVPPPLLNVHIQM